MKLVEIGSYAINPLSVEYVTTVIATERVPNQNSQHALIVFNGGDKLNIEGKSQYECVQLINAALGN
ncbi:hypothetical protein [Terriglobus roseus]|uniref:Uncharacterized protein n=1 Tax=Terriglobus roseus TaxID=392734 RepID=A0A1H4K6I9_9BACT|nr:hypothetical protein [Terriglobus roseus]SEB54141.1 hypothetical protein SAMN05443244_1034 [Terriglobus roseus]